MFVRQARPVTSSPRFGAGIEKHHEERAAARREKTSPAETYYFRNVGIHAQTAKAIQRLQESIQHPLPIVIDGDHRGKDAASQIALLQGETKLDYPELAKRFPITRRDIHKNDLDKGLKLLPKDRETFNELRNLDEEKYKPVTLNILLNHRKPEFRKALGASQTVDITDPTLPAPATASPNVRMAMQLLHYLEPAEQLNYIRDLAKSQGPGSLLILGANEKIEEMPEIHEELERLGYEPAPENKMFGLIDERFIYQKARNVAVPARDEKIEAFLHSDALKKDPTFAIMLSLQGFDLNDIDPENGETLLHYATTHNLADAGIAKEMVKAGADLKIKDNQGKTPLHYAAEFGVADVVQEMLKAGADPKIKDDEDKTAYDLARDYKQYVTMAVLRRHQKKA